LDDLELLSVRIFSEFRVISQIWEATIVEEFSSSIRENISQTVSYVYHHGYY